MGNGATKPLPKVSVAELETSPSSINLTPTKTEVIFKHRVFDHVQNTFFTKEPLFLKTRKQLLITVDSGAVLRIGLMSHRPQENSYLQSALFEEEDGFGAGSSQRSLYLNQISYLCYGEKDAEREYLPLEEGPVWLYVIVLFGSPNIHAVYDGINVAWSNFEYSYIGLTGNETTALCGSVTDAENCIISERLNFDDTYLIRWDMNLKQKETNKPAGKYLRHGFIRVALVDGKPRDVAQLKLTNRETMDDSVIWCTESAIRDYPYSGTLAFHVDAQARTISHNVLLFSVDHVTNAKNLDIQEGRDVFLVIELSTGSVKVEHGPDRDVRQSYGSILYLNNCQELPNEAAIRYKIAATGHDPCVIMYGWNPTSFVSEFRDKFSIKDISIPGFTKNIAIVEETRVIQVIGVPQELGDYDLKSFFSRESACGGDRIVNIKQSQMDKSIWMIEYEDTRVARRVLARQSYGLDGHLLTVLPYYQALGCSTNKGNKPHYDREPLSIQPCELLDGCQMHFFATRTSEINKLQQHMADKCMVELAWDRETSDDDDDDDIEMGNILIKCKIPHNDYAKLFNWKKNAMKDLECYFKDYLQEKNVQIREECWESCLTHLQHLSEREDFDFVLDEDTHMIRLVASKFTNLEHIVQKLTNISAPEISKTITLTREQSEKYLTLDGENKTQHLRERYKGVRFGVDKENLKVFYSGPEHEVNKMHQHILKLMLNVKTIAVQNSCAILKIATKKEQECIQTLCMNGIKGPVKISERSIAVSVFLDNDTDYKAKEQMLSTCIREMIKEYEIKINRDNDIDEEEFNTFKANIENRYSASVTFHKHDNVIKVVAWFEDQKAVKRDVQTFIDSHETSVDMLYITQDAAEYIDKWKMDMFDSKPSIEYTGDYYTGKVIVKGVKDTKDNIKYILQNNVKDIRAFWSIVSKPWLAFFIEGIPLAHFVQDHQCLVSVENGGSLAEQGIPAVSVLTNGLVAVKVIRTDILTVKAEAVVKIVPRSVTTSNNRNGRSNLKSGSSKGKCDCKTDATDNFSVEEGQLNCRVFIQTSELPATTNDNADSSLLEKKIKSILQKAEMEGWTSLAMPRFTYGSSKGTGASSCDIVVKAVKEHFQERLDPRSLHTIYLCDAGDTVLEFVDAMENGLNCKEWQFYKHGLELNTGNVDEESEQPKSEQPETEDMNTTIDENSIEKMRWNPAPYIQMYNKTTAAENFTESMMIEDPFAGGLPFKINISKKLRLHVIKGRIEKQKVDVIVCPTLSFPDISGVVAGVIQNAAGPTLVEECQELKSLDLGQVKQTKGGKLPCKHVYFIKIEFPMAKSTFMRISNDVETSLQIASQNNCTSVAFPTYDTHESKYPTDMVAEAMITAIKRFGTIAQSSSVTDVYIVAYDRDFGTIGTLEICVPSFFDNYIDVDHSDESLQDVSKLQDGKLKIPTYIPHTSSSEHSSTDDVVLVKTIAQTNCNDVRKKCRELIEKQFMEKELAFFFDHEEDLLSKDETEMIRCLAQRYKIDHHIESIDGKPVVKLNGLKKQVFKALPHLQDLVIRTIPDVRMKKKMGNYVSQNVHWLYDDNGTKKEVLPEYSLELYIGYIKGRNFRYRNGSTEFQVDVANLTEYPVNNPAKKRRLYLRNKLVPGIRIPEDWNSVNNVDLVCTYDLDPNDREFQDVKMEFVNAGCKAQILKIIRIENKTLWIQYQSKKIQLQRQNGNHINEQKLWHGTSAKTAKHIIEKGYDRGFVSVHVHGKGTYFAKYSSYSASYAHADDFGVQRMFYNDVLTGYSIKVEKDVAVLPVRTQTANEVILYDSAIGPDMFVIFNDTQAYPRYLIEFQV